MVTGEAGARYFYHTPNGVEGPLAPAEIARLPIFSPGLKVCREWTTDWATAAEFPEFKAAWTSGPETENLPEDPLSGDGDVAAASHTLPSAHLEPPPEPDSRPPQTLRARLVDTLVLFGRLSPALLAGIVVGRMFELLAVFSENAVPGEILKIFQKSALFDFLFFLQALPVLFPLYLLLCALPVLRRAPHILFALAVAALFALHGALVEYFTTAHVPLGADIFAYSLRDITTTAGAGASLDGMSCLLLLAPAGVFAVTLAVLLRGRLLLPRRLALALPFLGLLSFAAPSIPSNAAFRNEFAWAVAVNKTAFFVVDSARHLSENAKTSPPMPTVESASSDPGDQGFPFLHDEKTPDALGGFFNFPDPADPPDFVFILVEGLGRAFSGRGAYLGSFTPFLDELSERSLVWDNFLANQGRTFAVLPSILGSLPFGENGFNALKEKMPPHHTLVSILKKEGYDAGFFIGFDLEFDNQRAFMERQGTDIIVGKEDFGAEYKKSPGDNSWGYADADLFDKTLKMLAARAAGGGLFAGRRIEVVQTISMHTPYTVPGQDKFLERFEARLEELGKTGSERSELRTHKNIFSTILYTDEAIRDFIAEVEKTPRGKNTIFIITGDHRLPEIPMASKMDRYHVPFIIYSPLLKTPLRFRSVSSHMDVTPSLLALLRANFGMKTPDKVAWLGDGLDTATSFRNIKKIPLKQTIAHLHNFLSGTLFIDQETVFEVNGKLYPEPITDEASCAKVRSEFDEFKAKNARFAAELELVPLQ